MEQIELRNDRVDLTVGVDGTGAAWLQSYLPTGHQHEGPTWTPPVPLPLVEVSTVDSARRGLVTGLRHADSDISHRLRLRSHDHSRDGARQVLVLVLEDPVTGLTADYELSLEDTESVLTCAVRLTNRGRTAQLVTAVSSFTMTGFAHVGAGGESWSRNLRLWIPYSGWLSEARWKRHPLTDLGLDQVVSADHDLPGSMRRHVVSNTGTWSTSDYLPMGMLEDPDAGLVWAWEIAHNGSWAWEVGDRERDVYLYVGGPCDTHHQWRRELGPAESFETVPVAVAVTRGGFPQAVAALTQSRRRTRLGHRDNSEMLVVYNDFFNIWADPTTEKLRPVIDTAAGVGAEVFCVDAGWHDELDDGSDPARERVMGLSWWDAVGDWTPARHRFTHGLEDVLDRIRAHGMKPGLWMEPEVVGVRSPLVDELPPEALFRRFGRLVQDRGRYQLDFRHPDVVRRLDDAVDRLVDLGVAYLKLDYNIEAGTGTDVAADSPGDGLLQHNRAVLGWLRGLRERHPDLIIEGCASGGSRLDQAMLSLVPMQSTSDQKDPLLYAAVAANVRSVVPPEQCGCWAIPEPKHHPDELAVALCNAMLGRMLLSGRLQQMSESQLVLVREAVSTYKQLRRDLAQGLPTWPCGVPEWSDRWLVSGVDVGERQLVTVWNRTAERGSVRVPGADSGWSARVLFPRDSAASVVVRSDAVDVTFTRGPAACLIELGRPRGDTARLRSEREPGEQKPGPGTRPGAIQE
jgi:alpha-galactosidase